MQELTSHYLARGCHLPLQQDARMLCCLHALLFALQASTCSLAHLGRWSCSLLRHDCIMDCKGEG